MGKIEYHHTLENLEVTIGNGEKVHLKRSGFMSPRWSYESNSVYPGRKLFWTTQKNKELWLQSEEKGGQALAKVSGEILMIQEPMIQPEAVIEI